MRAYSIKTHEEAISLQNYLQTIPMIKQNSIESHLRLTIDLCILV